MNRKTILVPTDFSGYSKKALDFALYLGEILSAGLILFHTYIYNDTIFINPEEIEEENNKRYTIAREKLEKDLLYIHAKNTDIKARYIIEEGAPVSLINSLINSNNIDYVVMGTQGASGLKEIIIGSYTEEVVEHAECPVFAIPQYTSFKGINTIVCATDLHPSEIVAAKKALAFAEMVDAKVTFLHVTEDTLEEGKLTFFEKLIRTNTSYPKVQFKFLHSDKVIDEIEKYTLDNPVDLLVTLGKERNFYKKIFGKSVTKKLCLHTEVPLLSFPVSDFSSVVPNEL